MKPFVAVVVLTALASLAAAQQKSARPEPADPATPVPPARYESPFIGYMPYREQDVAPWAEVNEEVARAGGHVGIFGAGHAGHAPAKPAAKPPATSPAPAAKPAPKAEHGADYK